MTKLSDEVLERMARAHHQHGHVTTWKNVRASWKRDRIAAMQAAWDASPAGELVEALTKISRAAKAAPVAMDAGEEEDSDDPAITAKLIFKGIASAAETALSNLGAPHV